MSSRNFETTSKIQKITLIRPPLYYIEKIGHEEPNPPLGLLYLAGVLEKNYKIKILDCHRNIEQKERVDGTYSRAGLTDSQIEKSINSFSPDLVLLSVMWIHQWTSLKKIARLIKKTDPELKIVAGGLLPSSIPTEVCALPDIDYVVIGEGEESVKQLIEKLNNGNQNPKVPGLAYFDSFGRYRSFPMKIIKNLDRLPLPAYHLVDFNDYKSGYLKGLIKHWPMMGILPTRGCTYKCNFCSLPTIYGNVHRHHSVKRVIKEIELLRDEYGVKEIHFYDAHLLNDREFVVCLFTEMIKKDLTIPWIAEAGFGVWAIDEEILNLAIQSGMYRLDLPIESASSSVKKTIMNKGFIITQKIREIIDRARELGIERIYGYIIVGNPGEKHEDTLDSLMLLNSLDLDYRGIRFAQPFPGTEFYRTSLEQGYLPKDFSYDKLWFYNPIIETEEFDRVYLNAIVAADRALALIRKKIKNRDEAVNEIFLRYGPKIGEEALKQMEILKRNYEKNNVISNIRIGGHEFKN